MSENKPTPKHFTYETPGGNLQQGDIISRAGLKSAGRSDVELQLSDNCTCLLVLTQSCDLVPRKNSEPKADFIALAPAISMSDILENKVSGYQNSCLTKKANMCSENKLSAIREFLNKLINNNDSEYFYLHNELEYKLSKPMCALLRQAVLLNTKQYYSACLEARILGLKDEFRAKLGWLVGNIYSRVATQDWKSDNPENPIQGFLDDTCHWVNPQQLSAVEKKSKSNPGDIPESESELRKFVDKYEIDTKQDQILMLIKKKLSGLELSGKCSDDIARELCLALKADTTFSRCTK